MKNWLRKILQILSLVLAVACSNRQLLLERKQTINSMDLLTKTTIFLPLSGNLENAGIAIQRGILAAHFVMGSSISLDFIDENSDHMAVLYQRAVNNGAQLIIGPLKKEKIMELFSLEKLTVPVISLNTLEDYTHFYRPNLYQFGLCPQDELVQIAMRLNQFQKIGVVVFDEPLGKKLGHNFNHIYAKRYKGEVVLEVINLKKNFSEQVCKFLANETGELCDVKERLKKRGTEEEYLMRRQDLEVLFVIGNNLQAKQVVPLLKFYYADNLPIFVTATAYNGETGQKALLDLDGVYFCDLPWNLHKTLLSEEVKQAYKKLSEVWGSARGDQNRLYALGVDAYLIGFHFRSFLKEQSFMGGTGKISLDEFNHFYRELTWVQIKNNRLMLQ